MFPQFLRNMLLGALIVRNAQANYVENLAYRQLSPLVSDIIFGSSSSSDSTTVIQQSTSSGSQSSSIFSSSSSLVSSSTSVTSATVTGLTTSASSNSSSPSPSSTPTTSGASSTQPHTSPSPTSNPSPTTAGQQYTTIIVTTAGGSTWSFTTTGMSSSSSSTATPIVSDGSTTGLDANTRKTVIGVVVGVGGAVFLALIFLVVWKLWIRNRNSRLDDDDGLMMDMTPGEKSESGSSMNPFKSTLESYHNPAKTVNASSNF